MSITMFMILIAATFSLGSWAIIRQRSLSAPGGASFQVKMLQRFFLYMSIFSIIMFLPQLSLLINSSVFPIYMAWGYVIGHVFIYIAFIYTLRLTLSIVPRLADKQTWAVGFGVIATIAITLLNFFTMILGTLPQYDYTNKVILFNTHPAVGASIGLYAAISVLPAAILMIRNGINNPRLRVRSFLLGAGLFIIMTAGPLHDTATNWQLYMAADILSALGFFILAGGVLYRFEERIVPDKSSRPQLVNT